MSVKELKAAIKKAGLGRQAVGLMEKISRLDALRAYTSKGAYLTREEADKGQLVPGMLADFAVYGEDPFAVSDAALLQLQPSQTFLGGQAVWSQRP